MNTPSNLTPKNTQTSDNTLEQESVYTFDKNELLDNWHSVKQAVQESFERSHARSKLSPTKLIAVSKTKPWEMIQVLAEAGQEDFGENYLQEALDKIYHSLEFIDETGRTINWHYIGHIQRNKTRDIANHFDWVHTVDRFLIAERLHKQRPARRGKLNVLLQVNIDAEESKSGCEITELFDLVSAVSKLEQLELRGLMVIPQKGNAESFARTQQVFESVKIEYPELTSWDTLSMGMSADIDDAIAHGSTMVRVGSAIFGARR